METSHSFLVVQDGNGGSVSVTESVICHFKVKNCLLTRRQVVNLSPPLLDSLNNTILLSIKYSTVMKQDSTSVCYQTRHWLHHLKNQQTGGKNVKRESRSMLVQMQQAPSNYLFSSLAKLNVRDVLEGLATCRVPRPKECLDVHWDFP